MTKSLSSSQMEKSKILTILNLAIGELVRTQNAYGNLRGKTLEDLVNAYGRDVNVTWEIAEPIFNNPLSEVFKFK